MDVYGLIGYPVKHSLSPSMHEAVYEELGMEAKFCLFPVEKGRVEEAIEGAQALGIDGLNVTIPHKKTVANLDIVTLQGIAEKIGAVNVLDFTENGIEGYNTDALGALKALKSRDVEVKGKEVLLIGAGGASTAISFQLASEGGRIKIANRTEEKAYKLAEKVSNVGKAEGYPLENLEELIDKSDILINATSVGMEEDRSLVPKEFLRSDLMVFDVVYTPLETRLLKDARSVGAKTVDGAWMLVYQGAEAFEIWTGEEAPVNRMNKALREKLR